MLHIGTLHIHYLITYGCIKITLKQASTPCPGEEGKWVSDHRCLRIGARLDTLPNKMQCQPKLTTHVKHSM